MLPATRLGRVSFSSPALREVGFHRASAKNRLFSAVRSTRARLLDDIKFVSGKGSNPFDLPFPHLPSPRFDPQDHALRPIPHETHRPVPPLSYSVVPFGSSSPCNRRQ